MSRINKTNKAAPVDADTVLIYDSEDTSDDKSITLAQMKTFCATDITGKQDLITSPTNNHVVTTDGSGQTKDSGIAYTSVTTQGNTFNGNSQLVQLNSSGQYPALDGSLITGIDDKIDDKINPDKVTLTAGITNTLTSGKWHTLSNGSSTTTINMFSIVDSVKAEIAVVSFTTSSTTQPSFSGITWDDSKRNWDTSKRNLVTIFSDNNGTTYHGNHRILGA